MAATTVSTHDRAGAVLPARDRLRTDPAYQAYTLLRIAFTVAPIVFGLDKFANVLVDWESYLAPWIDDILPGSPSDAMHLVGVVEVIAGLAVAVKPRRLSRRGLARGDHPEPRHLLRLLRHRAARLRPDARRPHPRAPRRPVRPPGLGRR